MPAHPILSQLGSAIALIAMLTGTAAQAAEPKAAPADEAKSTRQSKVAAEAAKPVGFFFAARSTAWVSRSS